MQTSSPTLLTRFSMEIATSLFTALIGAVVTFGSLEFGTGWGDAGPQPGYFPFYVGVIVMTASAGALLQAIFRHRDRNEAFLTREQGARIFAFAAPMVAFVVLSVLLGMYVAMILYLFGVMVRQGSYHPLKAALVSVGTALVAYLILEVWFMVPLLKGPLEAWLGIH
jgi:hypothetical protein